MEWQEYIVAAIAVAACIWIIRRLRCALRRGGCTSCANTECPLRKKDKTD